MAAKSKHRAVFRYLERGIKSGRFLPGTQLPTELALVEELGVSRPTIARAMRDLQVLGLVERRAGSGSFVLENTSGQSEATFGLLVPELGCGDIFDPICAQLARRAQQLGRSVIWGDAGNSQLHTRDAVGRLDVSVDGALQAAASFAKRGVSGVFFAPVSGSGKNYTSNQRILSELSKAKIQVVLLDRDVECFPQRSNYDLVAVNHLVGQCQAANSLFGSGHRRLIYLQWPGASDSLQKRIAGMRIAAADCADPAAVVEVAKGDPRDHAFVSELVRTHEPDAVMCENDMVAMHLLQTLDSLGIAVPSELSVVGFNDIALAQHIGTPLSTIHQPCRELGNVAVDVMNSRIDEPNAPPRTVLLEPRLVMRESTRNAD